MSYLYNKLYKYNFLSYLCFSLHFFVIEWVISTEFQSILIFSIFQNKNFIVLLSNLSPGAKLGKKSAAVVNITNGKLVEKDAQAACIPSWAMSLFATHRKEGMVHFLSVNLCKSQNLDFFWIGPDTIDIWIDLQLVLRLLLCLIKIWLPLSNVH